VQSVLSEAALRRLLGAGRILVSDLDLDTVLRRVLEAAVEITGARYAAMGVLDEDRTGLESFIHHGIDPETRERIGDLPRGHGVLGVLIDEPRPLRLADVAAHPRSYGFPPEHPPMRTFLGVPVEVRGEPWGNLYLTEKAGGAEFGEADEAAALVLADWAGVAIANARSVAAERLRLSIEAAERERLQWARELHDQTLQGLAAIRLMLATARHGGGEAQNGAIDRSIEQIDHEIAALRALISDLRPDSLDQLGVEAALESLVARLEARTRGVRIGFSADRLGARPPASVEMALYRVAQEAMTNALRHGGASEIEVALRRGAAIELTIRDDGAGFDPASFEPGYGLAGMRERAELVGGVVAVESAPGGPTTVRLTVPIER
jgi:signal transduction histidine kinase